MQVGILFLKLGLLLTERVVFTMARNRFLCMYLVSVIVLSSCWLTAPDAPLPTLLPPAIEDTDKIRLNWEFGQIIPQYKLDPPFFRSMSRHAYMTGAPMGLDPSSELISTLSYRFGVEINPVMLSEERSSPDFFWQAI